LPMNTHQTNTILLHKFNYSGDMFQPHIYIIEFQSWPSVCSSRWINGLWNPVPNGCKSCKCEIILQGFEF
jgi:hypothetical protein